MQPLTMSWSQCCALQARFPVLLLLSFGVERVYDVKSAGQVPGRWQPHRAAAVLLRRF